MEQYPDQPPAASCAERLPFIDCTEDRRLKGAAERCVTDPFKLAHFELLFGVIPEHLLVFSEHNSQIGAAAAVRYDDAHKQGKRCGIWWVFRVAPRSWRTLRF